MKCSKQLVLKYSPNMKSKPSIFIIKTEESRNTTCHDDLRAGSSMLIHIYIP